MIQSIWRARAALRKIFVINVAQNTSIVTMWNRLAGAVLIMAALSGVAAWGQTEASWDTSGNGNLNGTYYFRHVLWVISSETDNGDLSDGIAFYGTITFNGNGTYTINGTYYDAAEGAAQQVSMLQGSYSISASGFGFMDNPVSSGDLIYGLVGKNGVFIGASTENDSGYNDLFIAAPLASPTPGPSALSGTYTIAGLDSPSGSQIDARDYMLTFTANGSNTISVQTNSVLGFVTANGGESTSQSFGNFSYTASNGAFVLNFPGQLQSDNQLLAGTHYLYMSSDGNFVFGGEPFGFDMFVGVKNPSSSPNFSGLYYAAGMDVNVLPILEGEQDASTPDSYYSSLVPVGANYVLHQRLNYFYNGPFDYTSADPLTLNSNGSEDDPYTGEHYVFGAGGAIRIGVGNLATSPILGISVGFQAPSFSGPGMYINPTGIQNAASSALFTAGIAPGELITIAGTGFPSEPPLTGLTLPLKMGNVQVMMNGLPAPLWYVTPTLIAAQVPFEIANLTTGILSIQVVNGSSVSNTVTLFTSDTQPGIFTSPPGGLGDAVAFHTAAPFGLVTASSPAVPGETIAVYVDGLGTVSPSVPDGQPSSLTTTSSTNFSITADFLDLAVGPVDATVAFAGLAPGYAGLYQLNVTVPSGTTSNYAYLELYGMDSTGEFVESYNSESVIPLAVGATTSAQPAAKVRAATHTPHKGAHSMHNHPHKQVRRNPS